MSREAQGMGSQRAPEVSEEEIRQALMLGEQLRAQITSLEDQRAYLASLQAEYARGRAALEGLEQAKVGDEILVPVGGGAHIRATVSDPDRVVSAVGANIHIEGSLAEAKARVQERLQGVEGAIARVDGELNRLMGELQRLQAGLSSLGLG